MEMFAVLDNFFEWLCKGKSTIYWLRNSTESLIAQKKTSSFSRNVTKQVKIVIVKDTGKSYTRSSYAAAIWGVLPLTLSSSSLGFTRWFNWILSLWCCWGTPHKLELGVFGCRRVSCSWTWLSALIRFLNPDVKVSVVVKSYSLFTMLSCSFLLSACLVFPTSPNEPVWAAQMYQTILFQQEMTCLVEHCTV